jgi:hypothetical protein
MIKEQIRSLATTPNPIDPENLPPPQVYILHNALTVIEKYWRTEQKVPYPPVRPEPYEIPEDVEKMIDESIGVLPLKYFKICVEAFLTNIKKYPAKKTDLLDGLAWALRPVKYLDQFKFKKMSCDVGPGRTIEDDRISKPSPIGEGISKIGDLKNLPTIAQVKHYALVRKAKPYEYIVKYAPSSRCGEVYKFMFEHPDYEKSKRGKRVYDNGFGWIADELEISLSTIGRSVKWLEGAKFLGKAWPANPGYDPKTGKPDKKKRRNSGWYVCTSMVQNLFLWTHPELFR